MRLSRIQQKIDFENRRLDNKRLSKIVFIGLLGIVLISLLFLNTKEKHINNKLPQSLSDGLGVSVHPGLKEQDIRNIADAGIKIVRIDIFWSNVEIEKGIYEYDKNGYDELNSLLNKYNIRPYYILNYENKLYEKQRSIQTEKGKKAFANFVSSTVKRYKNQNVIWEIWNEPNLNQFWTPQPSIKMYSKLVKEVAPIIKDIDPTGIVVAPALAGIHKKSLIWLDEFLKQGILNDIDAISVHPYRDDTPESALYDYQKTKEIISKYTNNDVPIFSGEWGYAMQQGSNFSVNELEQAEYLVRSALVNSMANISISIWYDWKNDGMDTENKEHNFGVMWYNSNPKLSYLALQTLSDTVDGYKFINRMKTERKTDFILKFKNSSGKYLIVYWTTAKNHNLDYYLDADSGKIISMLGAVRNIKGNRKVSLNFSKSPNYLIIE